MNNTHSNKKRGKYNTNPVMLQILSILPGTEERAYPIDRIIEKVYEAYESNGYSQVNGEWS
jgi:hypothetical protein